MKLIGILLFVVLFIFVCIIGIVIGRMAGFDRISDLEEMNKNLSNEIVTQRSVINDLQSKLVKRTTELEEGKEKWKYFESRFVECNECDPAKKEKCLMFTENLCEGDRCKTLVDLEALIDKACDKEIKEIAMDNQG